LTSFIDQFGDLTCPVTGGTQCRQGSDAVIQIVLELSGNTNRPMGDTIGQDEQRLQEHFLSRFEGERREYALAMLELGRNSYKLRDDDNIYLGRIEAQLYAPLREAQMRLAVANEGQLSETKRHQLKTALDGFEVEAATAESGKKKSKPDSRLKARQVVGQPAGPGLASGTARVIRQHDDLLDFKRDEILVCDAVDPNMTFIVPLVAAVVERRGGMLIHGAIIAREYGIPCVTGVPDATNLIHTGDYVTVDGFLGLVTLGTAEL